MDDKKNFIKICFYIGALADLLATIILLFPNIAMSVFGVVDFEISNIFLYNSRIGASLMAGWTALLLWGSHKPVERKGVLLLTLFPALFGLVISQILIVVSGAILLQYMLPLWIFYAVVIPLYISAYIIAGKIVKE